MPYFLQGQIRHPVGIESEYARILAEQGFIGLTLWISFIVWCMARRTAFLPNGWRPARRMIWYWAALSFLTASLGIGMLTGIPGTFFFLLALGWTVVTPEAEVPMPFQKANQPRRALSRAVAPIYN